MRPSGDWKQYEATDEMYVSMLEDIMSAAQKAGIPKTQETRLTLGVEEMLGNIVDYAYEGHGPIWIRAGLEGDFFRLDFADHGHPFNPLAKDMRHEEGLPVEEMEEGGFGIYFVRKYFDRMEYDYRDFQGKKANILSLMLKVLGGSSLSSGDDEASLAAGEDS